MCWIYKWNGLQGHKEEYNKGLGQVNDTNIQDNWTSQDKYNGWQYKMVQYKWTSKQKRLSEQIVNMWICVQLYAIIDVVISLISVNNKFIQINKSVRVTGDIASLQNTCHNTVFRVQTVYFRYALKCKRLHKYCIKAHYNRKIISQSLE